jgi:hypothetical protein
MLSKPLRRLRFRSALGPLTFATVAVSVATFAACGSSDAPPGFADGSDAGDGIDTGSSTSGFGDSGAVGADATTTCVAPDMLIALDRTLTMHFAADGTEVTDDVPGHARTKWSQAIDGIKQFTAAPLDQGIRFGLELWPKKEPGCITLGQRIKGMGATNAACEDGEILVDTDLGSGLKITAALDPETTPICTSTPTGAALLSARTYLQARQSAGKKQFIALVTDGADWSFSCPTPDPLTVVDQLTASGISTIIVGFSSEATLSNGVGGGFLNDMACAGGTAKDFATSCTKNASGLYRANNPDAGPSNTLFYVATNTAELTTNLQGFAKTVCCDCVK